MTAQKTESAASFAYQILSDLHLPINPKNIDTLVAWEAAEGGSWHNTATYNPLNTTLPEPGSRGITTGTGANVQHNVQAYTSWAQGEQATEQTLLESRYSGVIDALKRSDPTGVVNAVTSSPWGTKSIDLHADYRHYGPPAGGFAQGGTVGALQDIGTSVAQGAGDVLKPITSVADFIGAIAGKIFSVSFWTRVLVILIGFAFLYVGVKSLIGDGSSAPASDDGSETETVTYDDQGNETGRKVVRKTPIRSAAKSAQKDASRVASNSKDVVAAA